MLDGLRRIDDETVEIYRHAVIGGVIAVALTAFHALVEKWARDSSPVVSLIALLLVTFVAVFALIALLGHLLRKWQSKAKIRLQDSGEIIDGDWGEVIIENGRPCQASVITITSARGDGFTVAGTSYEIDQNRTLSDKPWGSFISGRGALFPGNGITYPFSGKQGNKDHFGVGFYQFGRPAAENGFEGAFLVRQARLISHVIGRKLPNVSLPDKLSILQGFVKEELVAKFVAKHPSAPDSLGDHKAPS